MATFRLGRDEERYGRALQLTCMAYGWKATTFEVDGSPEYPEVIREMLHCARGWLHREGRCRAIFAAGVPPKCRVCPLYEPEWALESLPRPSPSSLWDEAGLLEVVIPDGVPPEWEKDPPGSPG